MRFGDVREVQGRPLPHTWSMETLNKPGHTTTMVLEEMEFDAEFEDSLFSLTNLKRSEAVR